MIANLLHGLEKYELLKHPSNFNVPTSEISHAEPRIECVDDANI